MQGSSAIKDPKIAHTARITKSKEYIRHGEQEKEKKNKGIE